MKHAEVTLDDKYALLEGRVFLTGIQALVRLPLDQKRRDKAAGLNTAGFISGYRGSPLGGYDQQIKRAGKFMAAHDVTLWEGLNEDLGATAVWGAQQAAVSPQPNRDGVFGIWYGKAPGVDRTGDVFKHANFAGVSRFGGVVAVAGDDHGCKSSTLPSQSEFAFMDAEIPVLNPANVQDVLDFGLYGFALSRYSGLWVGMIALADTMDSGAVVDVGPARTPILLPDDFVLPLEGVHIRQGDEPMAKELRLRTLKLPAAHAFLRANRLDRVVLDAPRPRLGIVATGQAARDVFEALDALGLSPDEAADLGIAVYKVAMPWPLEPQGLAQFAAGLETLLVLEHKRPLMEPQIRDALYHLPDWQRPRVLGKRGTQGAGFLPDVNVIPVPVIAKALYDLLPEGPHQDRARAYLARVGLSADQALALQGDVVRKAHYCSGCPHNTSTVVPDGSRALAGIGCHYMANFMGRADFTSQMGGEGVSWIGASPFTDESHVFVNLGDGTYSHSGSLAIRAALTGKVNITYKILYNGAVAMTGGQQVESDVTPAQITRQLHAEGVQTIVIVADDESRYLGIADLAPGVKVYPRSELDAVQRRLRDVKGVSVLIYDQMCATEKRRRVKRNLMAGSTTRAFINSAVCEGCGDCSAKSNCLSIEPLETEFGRKRQINQNSCNQDLRCVDGFCPSFVTIEGADPKSAGATTRPSFDADALPIPEPMTLDRTWNIVMTGVGGTGVTTIAAIVGMAAHIDGKAAVTLDMTGLAQKGGAVFSHIRIAPEPEMVRSGRVPPASADVLIACDMAVASSKDALGLLDGGRSVALGNADLSPTAEFIGNRNKAFSVDPLARRVEKAAQRFAATHADALAENVLGDSIYSNMVMLGFAWGQGLVPVSQRALYRAIKLNGVAVDDNMRAFDLGRLAAHDPAAAHAMAAPNVAPAPVIETQSLSDLIARRIAHLTGYQNAAYAARYQALVDEVAAAERKAGTGERLTRAVAIYFSKLMAYKDEYEVARLYTDGAFAAALKSQFGDKGKLSFHLAPPLFAPKDKATGHLRKIKFGGWMLGAFKLLAAMKALRGTAFDVAGWTEERKMERRLRDEYEIRIRALLPKIGAGQDDVLLAIASMPDEIRGFGHVKEASVKAAEAKLASLMAQLR